MNAFVRDLVVVFAACTASACAHGSIVLGPSADAGIVAVNPNNNYGANPQISIYNNGGNVQRIVTLFDLPSLPSGESVVKATLRMTAYKTQSHNEPMDVYRITAPWDESTVTWNTSWVTPGGDYVGSTGGRDVSPYATTKVSLDGSEERATISWDITSLVQEWYGGKANYGLVLLAGEGNQLVFFSREGGVESESLPALEITTSAVPEPTTIIAGALLLLPLGASARRMLCKR